MPAIPSVDASPWWSPDVYADRRPFLLARQRLQGALRGFFAARDFVEVETPILQVSPGNEIHLKAFATELERPDGTRAPRYLHTSPEFTAKKLLAAGEPRLFTLARVFRNGERTALHHPEFTMLEWYRAGESYEALMVDCAALLALTAEVAGASTVRFGGVSCDLTATPERLTVAEAFTRHAGIDLMATLSATDTDRDALSHAARAAGIRVAEDDGWADVFTRIMVEKVEPVLGIGRPTILCEYPISEAALARPKPGDPRIAERFELYVCAVELANAFGELTDAAEQRRRFEGWMDEKQRLYGERYPIDEEFLVALAHMPEASGIALGFDRLAMLASGARRIDEVLWAPVAP
ncbi:EF-P lysine aminoacylase EpmA [Ancylobacter sp. WKF20]|uniref:EF-P lysine aminoacylase EpmA n=1 Tax=Ancylobacter sp. WKF20 TaxID=3039801 RepID=UPI0024342F05|nr:EF-P lysine aminoacylase EpmA [Ancylobacter sp. WKF20]WGD31138.1 EF-P lysine aminoacylase EpmA [Ancylobacter sp. WKF20]